MLMEQDYQHGLRQDLCICIGRCPGDEDNEWGIWEAEINEVGQIVTLISVWQMPQEKESLVLAKLIADELMQSVYRILPNNDLELIQSPILDQ